MFCFCLLVYVGEICASDDVKLHMLGWCNLLYFHNLCVCSWLNVVVTVQCGMPAHRLIILRS